MNKYQNQTFRTTKEAIAYKKSFKDAYGIESHEPIIKIMESTDRVPKGTIIAVLDETESCYILNPFCGMGSLVYIPKRNCERVC